MQSNCLLQSISLRIFFASFSEWSTGNSDKSKITKPDIRFNSVISSGCPMEWSFYRLGMMLSHDTSGGAMFPINQHIIWKRWQPVTDYIPIKLLELYFFWLNSRRIKITSMATKIVSKITTYNSLTSNPSNRQNYHNKLRCFDCTVVSFNGHLKYFAIYLLQMSSIIQKICQRKIKNTANFL